MKELTIEQKAQRYDEVLEGAKEWYSDAQIGIGVKANLEKLIPELKELDDEEVRKTLIKFFEDWHQTRSHCFGLSLPKILAWLEKQRKSELSEDLGEYVVELSKQFPEVSFGKLARIAVRVKNFLEKQGEKPVEEYNITSIYSKPAEGKLGEIVKDIASTDKVEPKDYNSIDPHFGKPVDKTKPKFKVGDEIKTDNEKSLTITKIDEKGYWSEDLFICSFEDSAKWELVGKLISKVEPKFKVGDWVVVDGVTQQVTQIRPEGFDTDRAWNGKLTFKDVHLWTLQDAKEGDVLWHSDSASNGIFIFKEIRSDGKVLCYCDYDSEDHFCTGEHHTCCWSNDKYIKPATKAQRDTLFAKMHEAGYTFDFEKKELKKIDNEIEIPFGAKDSELQEATYYIPQGFHAEIDDNKVVIKKGEKPTAWSEEDEEILEDVRNNFEYNKGEMTDSLIAQYDKFFDKIKFLKPQPKQEWSEEDEKMIDWSITNLAELMHRYGAEYGKVGKCIDWLKSIKDRVGCEANCTTMWKPSDEQMKALEAMITASPQSPAITSALLELHEQLKKLKGE